MPHPVFIPASRIALWNRMATGQSSPQGNQWGQYIKACADGRAPGAEQNLGQWNAWWYAATGDTHYAQSATSLLNAFVLPGPQGSKQDSITDNIVRALLVYDLLYNYLVGSGQEQPLRDAFNTLWVGWLRSAQHGSLIDIRTHDADAADADYWLLAMCDLAFTPSPGYLQGQYFDSTLLRAQPVGGLDYQPALGPYGSLRNILEQFVTVFAQGGRWFYSSGYNLNLERYDALAVDAVHCATGQDHFPAWTALFPLLFVGHVFELTGDFQIPDQWGDVEKYHRQVDGSRYADLMGVYEGLLNGNGVIPANAAYGPIAWSWWQEFQTVHYPYFSPPQSPTSYFIFQFNPEATPTTGDWRAALAAAWGSNLHNATQGPGRAIYQPSLLACKGAADPVGLMKQAPLYSVNATWDKTRVESDHYQFYKWVGGVKLYHKGAPALWDDISYALATDQHDLTNGVLHAGLSAMYQQGPQAVEADATGTGPYVYFRAGTAGPYYGLKQPVNNPPAAFVTEHTRSVFGLPSSDGTQDTLVLFDRINSTYPTEIDRYQSGSSFDQQKILSPMTRALKMLCWHSPTEPVQTPGPVLTWPVTGGQVPYAVDLAPLLPVNNVAIWSFNENGQPWFNGLACGLEDCRDVAWQTRVYPQADAPYLVFLTVVNAYDNGQKPVYTLVQDTQGLASGVLLTRGANTQTLVMDGVAEAGRVISAPFSFTLPGKGMKLACLFGSLDTTKSWSLEVGTRVTKLRVTANGIGGATLWCGMGKPVTVYPG